MNRMVLLETLDSLRVYGKKVKRWLDKSENARDAATAIFVPGGPAIVAAKRWKRKTKMTPPQTSTKIKNSLRLSGKLREVFIPQKAIASGVDSLQSVGKDMFQPVKDTIKRGASSVGSMGSKLIGKAQDVYRKGRIAVKRTIPRKIGGALQAVGRGFGNVASKLITGTAGKVGAGIGAAWGINKGFKEPENLQASLRIKYGKLREGDDEIEMKKSEFKKEHKHLFKVLRKCKDKMCKKELRKQKSEYKKEMKESFKSRQYLDSLIESSPKRISQIAKDAYGRPMIGNLTSSINPGAKSAGVSFAKAAKQLKTRSMGSLLHEY